jgi:cellulose synthase/poly-beta-1,6-N-acetylglucosamine synthase-like glycosyltransferase
LTANQTSRFLVVIPAHDEESVIATTVRSCLSANYPASRFSVVVIADNCSDKTASVATAAGARVIERFDPLKKTKGYALEFLITSLERSGELEAFDALVVIDADTTIDPHLLRSFDFGLEQGRDWIQAYYTVANPDQSWRTRLLTYAFSLYNGVLLLGQKPLGGSAGFKGNGMCFSVPGLRRVPWKCYGLVEDVEYSWTLRVAGEKIAFQPDVSVYATMLSSGGPAAVEQRRRWEFGRAEVRRKYLGPLLRSEKLGLWEKLLSVCELTIPSLVGLALIYVFLMICDMTALLSRPTDESLIVRGILFACSLLMTLSLFVYALSPYIAMRLPWRYLLSVAFFPFYLGWKMMVSAKGRPDRWVRTAREETHRDTSETFEDHASTTR